MSQPSSVAIADVLLRDAADYLRDYLERNAMKADHSYLRYVEAEGSDDLAQALAPS
jgi:hypothetical protein